MKKIVILDYNIPQVFWATIPDGTLFDDHNIERLIEMLGFKLSQISYMIIEGEMTIQELIIP